MTIKIFSQTAKQVRRKKNGDSIGDAGIGRHYPSVVVWMNKKKQSSAKRKEKAIWKRGRRVLEGCETLRGHGRDKLGSGTCWEKKIWGTGL
jgi:prophage tail gpP-like protein